MSECFQCFFLLLLHLVVCFSQLGTKKQEVIWKYVQNYFIVSFFCLFFLSSFLSFSLLPFLSFFCFFYSLFLPPFLFTFFFLYGFFSFYAKFKTIAIILSFSRVSFFLSSMLVLHFVRHFILHFFLIEHNCKTYYYYFWGDCWLFLFIDTMPSILL